MTPEEARRLADEAEKLADAASEGPWTAHHMNASLSAGWLVTCLRKFGRAWKVNEQDAKFIADARTRVPALVAALRELADENERLRQNAIALTQAWEKRKRESDNPLWSPSL